MPFLPPNQLRQSTEYKKYKSKTAEHIARKGMPCRLNNKKQELFN